MALLSFKWKIHDALIGIFGGISGALGRIVIAFATKSWMMYLGSNYLLKQLQGDQFENAQI